MRRVKHKAFTHHRPIISGRTQTIARIAAQLEATLGRPPSDAEIAKLLATSEAMIARHRVTGGRP